MMRKLVRLAIVVLFQAVLYQVALGDTRFEISYDKSARSRTAHWKGNTRHRPL